MILKFEKLFRETGAIPSIGRLIHFADTHDWKNADNFSQLAFCDNQTLEVLYTFIIALYVQKNVFVIIR